MKKVIFLFVVLVLYCGCSSSNVSKTLADTSTKINFYEEAQKEFTRKNYLRALELFKKYVELNKKSQLNKKLFWSIDQIGYIYLRVHKSPDDAITFFDNVLKGFQLSETEDDHIQEWLSVSKEWKKLGKKPDSIKNPNDLFYLGKKFYDQGMSKIESFHDSSGNADFYIAASYLVPYVFNYDSGSDVGKALFMLGNIRYRSWNDYEYWTENFYLKEVIRRFPNSSLSWKAFSVLEKGIKDGYTGTAGSAIPVSQLNLLKKLEILAKPKKKQEEERDVY